MIDEGAFDAASRPYQIPYRCLTPRKEDCANLLVPVCLSASHIAYGSLRMEPVYMALGHAAGLAAAQAAREGVAVQAVDVVPLREQLREQQAVLELPGLAAIPWAEDLAGIVMDDEAAEFEGVWSGSGYGNPVNGSARHDGDSGKGTKRVRFVTRLPESGRYRVGLAYTTAPNRAAGVPVRIRFAGGERVVHVDQRKPLAQDDPFLSLGVYPFKKDQPAVLEISNAGTRGFVSVDAIQFLPVKDD